MQQAPMIDIVVPAKDGVSLIVEKDDLLRIIDIEGKQVSDLLAFNFKERRERISGPQTNKLNARLNLKKGDILYSTDCNPVFTIADCKPYVHYNFIFSPCGDADNRIRFPEKPGGETCLGILTRVLSQYELDPRDFLEPFSIGLNLKINDDGSLETFPPTSKKGDYIDLRAEMKSIIGISACPQDRNSCNGSKPKPIRVQLYRPKHYP